MATSSTYNNWTSADTAVGLKVTNGAPLDRRFVVDTFANYSRVIPKACRYPGLRFYVLDEEKEYWFKSGTEKADLVEYHPEAMFVESDLEDVDTTKLAVGSEVTIFDSEGNPTKYVWNGSNWKPLIREVGSVVTPIITNISTDTYEELETLINGHIQANGITVAVGTELPIIFVDTAEEDKNADIYNKYVYLNKGDNGHWYQESGTQVFRFTIPEAIKEAEQGTEITGDPNTVAKYVKFVKGADSRVDVVISHNFCLQYVDTSFYKVGSGEVDKDFDGVLDSDWGEEVFIPEDLVKSNGEYKLVLTFFQYGDEEDDGGEFVAVLQR